MKSFLLLSAVLIVLFVVGAKTTATQRSHGAPTPQIGEAVDTMAAVSIKVASGK